MADNEEKLVKMLKYVSEHNDFYKKRIKEYGITNPLDITQWPILTRKELQENRYNMFSDGYKSKYFNQQLRRQSSSGSSGVPVDVYWDPNDYYASIRCLWKDRLLEYGIHPNNRYVTFGMVTDKNSELPIFYKQKDNVLNINISYIHKNNKYEMLIEIINEFKPKWLFIRPFILENLIYNYQYLSVLPPTSISYIESYGELLSPELKQKAISFFNVPIVNMYGSEEMNCIAYEYRCHDMHILKNNVLVECLNNSSIYDVGEGEAIVTNLFNKAMPLIRYNQGDEIVLNNSRTCLCGYVGSTISLIKGRSFDIIKSNGVEINSIMLFSDMAKINNRFSNIIISYKFIYYKRLKRLQCFIKLDSQSMNWFDNVKSTIENELMKSLFFKSNITIEVLYYDLCVSFNKKHRVLEIVE